METTTVKVKCEIELDYKTAQTLLGAIKQINCDMEMGEYPTYWDDNDPDYNKNEDFGVAENVEERNGTVVKNFLKKVLHDSKADELLLGVIFA